jgi:hypothetical protein
MDNQEFGTISPDGRFKILESAPSTSGDHFYPETDIEWALIEIATGKTLHTFYGDWSRPESIQTVKFSKDGKEVLAKNKRRKIVERFDLSKF